MRLVRRPDEAALERLFPRFADAPCTYPEVGATAQEHLPAGYHHVRRELVLPGGPGAFEHAAEAFVVERRGEQVIASISAFSVAGAPLVRVAGPLARGLQAWMTHRYLRSLQVLGGLQELSEGPA